MNEKYKEVNVEESSQEYRDLASLLELEASVYLGRSLGTKVRKEINQVDNCHPHRFTATWRRFSERWRRLPEKWRRLIGKWPRLIRKWPR